MDSRHPLDRLVEQDTFAEMLALLEPEELIIAFLRLEGLSDDQIAALLDVDRATVHRRTDQARQRIVEELPELAPQLRDRRHPPQHCQRPLERGWICPSLGGEPGPLIGSPPRQEGKGEPPADDSPTLAVPDQMVRAGTA
jgi:hypothetical protein